MEIIKSLIFCFSFFCSPYGKHRAKHSSSWHFRIRSFGSPFSYILFSVHNRWSLRVYTQPSIINNYQPSFPLTINIKRLCVCLVLFFFSPYYRNTMQVARNRIKKNREKENKPSRCCCCSTTIWLHMYVCNSDHPEESYSDEIPLAKQILWSRSQKRER